MTICAFDLHAGLSQFPWVHPCLLRNDLRPGEETSSCFDATVFQLVPVGMRFGRCNSLRPTGLQPLAATVKA